MGVNLWPRHKDVDMLSMGSFSWHWMLNAGVGLPIGHGPGHEPATFVYKVRPDGRCAGDANGARVTAKEAKQMAMVARWLCEYLDIAYNQWMLEPESERKRMEADGHHIYRIPVRRDFVDKARAFADFAERSGGFVIR